MSYEFDDSEMYPCDICGEGFPIQLMFELEDGSIICENCIRDIEQQTENEASPAPECAGTEKSSK